MIDTKSYVKRVLFVVHVPENLEDWISVKEYSTTVKRCGYWIDLKGSQSTNNKEKTRIAIPKTNLLTPDSIKNLMQEAATFYSELLEKMEAYDE